MTKEAAYCGIDVGLKAHVVCLLDKAQNTIKRYSLTNDLQGFRTLEADVNKHTKICLEPTGVYSLNVFLYFRNKGCDIRFCKTDSSHDFRESMFRKKKHDRLDALALAKYRIVNEQQTFDGSKIIERLGADVAYDPEYQVLSGLIDQYLSMRKKMTRLHNRIKNLIDLRFPEAIMVFPGDRGCKTIRAALVHSKEDILSGKIQLRQLADIQEKLRHSIGQYDMKRLEFQNYTDELNALEARITQLESAIKDTLHDMGYDSLFDYYGLNTIGIAVLVKEIRDIRCFYRYSVNGNLSKKKSLRAFKKFLGITVSSNQSGTKEGGHTLTRGGNMALRNIIFLMAMRYVQINPSKLAGETGCELNPVMLKSRYDALVAGGKRKMVALTKVMSKIATDLFFIFKRHAGMHGLSSASAPVPAIAHTA